MRSTSDRVTSRLPPTDTDLLRRLKRESGLRAEAGEFLFVGTTHSFHKQKLGIAVTREQPSGW